MENLMKYDLEKSFEVLQFYLQKICVDSKNTRISDDSDCRMELESALCVILDTLEEALSEARLARFGGGK